MDIFMTNAAGHIGSVVARARVRAVTAENALAALWAHAFGMTMRDVALEGHRARAIGWKPRFADFEQGVRTIDAAVRFVPEP